MSRKWLLWLKGWMFDVEKGNLIVDWNYHLMHVNTIKTTRNKSKKINDYWSDRKVHISTYLQLGFMGCLLENIFFCCVHIERMHIKRERAKKTFWDSNWISSAIDIIIWHRWGSDDPIISINILFLKFEMKESSNPESSFLGFLEAKYWWS